MMIYDDLAGWPYFHGRYTKSVKARKRTEPIQPKLRLRDRRRRLLLIKIASASALAVALLVGLFFVLRLPEVTISKVEVTGAHVADAALIQRIVETTLSESYAFLIPKRNALFIPTGEIAANITGSFPVVKGADIAHTSLTSVSVLVTERAPVAVWCAEGAESLPGACYLMDEDGVIYMTTGQPDAYVRYGGAIGGEPVGAVFLSGGFSSLNAFVGETAKTLGRTPETVFVESNKDVSLTFVGGGELKFVMTEDGTGTLENIASVFASQKLKGRTDFEYADFRFGNKIYVKFKE